MRNDIVSFEKSSISSVTISAKSSAKINSRSMLLQIVTKLLLDFSKKVILYLIYLLADKDNFCFYQFLA